jgi:glycosyltransferase involved in cell wall biosynthesis
MKILLIMDPGIPVPPPLYGGHERLVYMFAQEYQRQGHEVSLLAGPDSNITGTCYAFGENNLEKSASQKNKELLQAWAFLRKRRNEFDLIHNFGRLIYLLPVLNNPVKKIMTYGRPVSGKGIKIINRLPNRNLIFTACSDYCVSTGNVAGKWQTVYNAIDFAQYRLTENPGENAPLMFLGRLDKVKGVHTAIKVAKATNHQLIIAGNIPHTADNLEYFKTEIEPLIDGVQIKYVGALNDAGKNDYLGQAKALLFPIEWDEPFGMVMVEAMACGTPVIAFSRGSVPEVVTGQTGIKVNTFEEMVVAVKQVSSIDRKLCRETAWLSFDCPVIAKQYLQLFSTVNKN